jgi:hypothetical protein
MLPPSSATYGSSGPKRRVARIKTKIVAGVGV